MKMEGRVKNVVSAGYGFIDTKKHIDFFFHHTEFKGDWKNLLKKFVCGDIIIVEFDNDPDARQGPKALNVRIKDSLDEPEEAA
jgi:cold shock CspA family protein